MNKISIPGNGLSVLHNRKEGFGSKMQTLENEITESINVSCRENLNEYLYNSSLHGLRYVGDRKISRWERAFFACTFFLVVIFSIYFISSIWMKWSASPIIISLSSRVTTIKHMPFPAITICNMNRVRKSAVEKIPKNSSELSVVKSLCRGGITSDNEGASGTIAWPLYRKVLLDVTPPCEDMLLYCEFGHETFDCKKRFRRILTDDGLCCIFNGAHGQFLMRNNINSTDQGELDENGQNKDTLNEWTPENGFASSEILHKVNSTPRPGVGPGNEMGLSLVMNVDMFDYHCSSTRSYGFKVLLHSPNDLPKIAHYGVAIANGYESRIVIQPTIMEASNAVRTVDRRIRRCLFENENDIEFYSTYSERNCESECETKKMYDECGCVLYYMPRWNENITICGRQNAHCVYRVDYELQVKRNTSYKCSHCYTGCFALSYETSFSTAKIFEQEPFLLQSNRTPKNVAIVHIYYAKSSFRAQRIEELVGFADFLSNMGGLLGLFMGFSVISVIEMFYFISIRPYYNYLRLSKRRREIVSKIVQRMGNLRHRKSSPIIIRTVQANSVIDKNYPFMN